MTLFSDYHNHPLGHDPNRKYSLELLGEWLEVAQKKGLTDIAFTDHDRYHEGVNFDDFERFYETLPANIKFKLGIELDNDPETSLAGKRWTEKNYDKLDFVLGSVHFIGEWAFDHPSYKAEFENWNINKLYETYFKEIQKTAKSDLVDGLAHLDLIKIFNYLPTADLSWVFEETLEIIKKQNKTLEISTAGWRKPINEIYPSEQIIAMARQKEIPITIASDAHAPNHLGEDYNRLAEILKKHNFKEVAIFEKHKRIMRPLKDL